MVMFEEMSPQIVVVIRDLISIMASERRYIGIFSFDAGFARYIEYVEGHGLSWVIIAMSALQRR